MSTFAQVLARQKRPSRKKQVSKPVVGQIGKFTPKSYQEDSINWIISNIESGLFLSPGLGKTAISLVAFYKLKKAGNVSKLFVVAPLRVCRLVWPQEVKKWGLDLTIGVLHGPKKSQTLNKDYDVYVINPEGLKWLSGAKRIKEVLKTPTWLVVDESSMFRNGRSVRYKILSSMCKMFRRHTILTGTPAPNGLEGLWGQVKILDGGKRLGKFITHYRNQYFYPSGYGGYTYLPQEGAEEKIYAAIDDIIMHKGRDELDLPPLISVNIDVELPEQARKIYQEMKDEFLAVVEEVGIVAATTGAVKTGKLRQITSGFLYGENKEVLRVHDEKIEALKELVDGLEGQQLMIFYEFIAERKLLKETFGEMRFIGSGSKSDEKTQDAWNSGKLQLLALNPKSAGHGLNLQAGNCSDICWFTTPWDLEMYEQSYSRVWRQGVEVDSVTMHHITAIDTTDQIVAAALIRKESVQEALKNALTK